jgi:hypothetical protein
MTWVMPWASLYEYIITNGLNETLLQASKLVNLILAVPGTKTSVERPFWAVKRIEPTTGDHSHRTNSMGMAFTST